ncbi:hypothetical protein F4820DRAFT_450133 [Hypoxylon rubiginosum]|uniref:Uncharacterized protein n=1 Tax=Hypoxylon rubiginosum TaxID=110542 RepID=A0ACB9YX44_9PEZI|nr:hypothetical protein F4820DRAFT_450133 [Hypoxylon rubiginosum]
MRQTARFGRMDGMAPLFKGMTPTHYCEIVTQALGGYVILKDLLGFLVHPDIPTRATDLKVADVATGNGIWIHHDVARNKPTAEFHGFDISLDQVGPKPWLPANISMHAWDIFQEPPARFMGYFDVVHVRLITVVVRNNDPQPVLANLTKLLKPGGYLQWDEVDTIGSSTKVVSGRAGENLDELFAQLKGRDTWKYHLAQIMEENGYAGSQLYTYEYGLRMARIWSDV